ncbi:MAG: peptidylprolyl isomerase [Thermoguttaceae bacterium]|nr:peptidylprolyl isomerase [Thermoguttaceae bacterium]
MRFHDRFGMFKILTLGICLLTSGIAFSQTTPPKINRGAIPAPVVKEDAPAATPVTPPAAAAPATSDPATETDPAAETKTDDPIVAIVNGDKILRSELRRDALARYGTEVLEALVNKQLIAMECERNKIKVDPTEVQREIERIAKRFGITVEQYLGQILESRGVTRLQYEADVVWPMLALQKLAADQLKFTDEELMREFETQYGESIKALMILVSDKQKAEDLHAKAVAEPDSFGDLAKNNSEDYVSASAKGVVPPVRRHTSDPKIEEALFALPDGGITDVFEFGGSFIFLKRLEKMPAAGVVFEEVRVPLEENLRARKVQKVANELFKKLQADAKIENVLNDPEKSKQMPGVAALINGSQVRIDDLADRCVERYGSSVLQVMIEHKLIEQMLKTRQVTVTPEDIDAELIHQAELSLPLVDGKPDVSGFIRLAMSQDIPESRLRSDIIWPMVALKKLVDGSFQIGDEELKMGFEAQYGARVRARAIYCDNLRRAQEAWDLARKDPSAENFGKLAQQYSIDPSSRDIGGQIPPIQKYTGSQLLEDEAFKLKDGEISSVISLGKNQRGGEYYVILRCEGQTEPVDVDFETVKDQIHEDIAYQKRNIQAAAILEAYRNNSSIDNFIDGTSSSPEAKQDADKEGIPNADKAAEEVEVQRTENTTLNP